MEDKTTGMGGQQSSREEMGIGHIKMTNVSHGCWWKSLVECRGYAWKLQTWVELHTRGELCGVPPSEVRSSRDSAETDEFGGRRESNFRGT